MELLDFNDVAQFDPRPNTLSTVFTRLDRVIQYPPWVRVDARRKTP